MTNALNRSASPPSVIGAARRDLAFVERSLLVERQRIARADAARDADHLNQADLSPFPPEHVTTPQPKPKHVADGLPPPGTIKRKAAVLAMRPGGVTMRELLGSLVKRDGTPWKAVSITGLFSWDLPKCGLIVTRTTVDGETVYHARQGDACEAHAT